jgi:hypothetical protein
MSKPLKLHKYQKWIRQYGWSLYKGGIDWNLFDQNGNYVCSIKIQHPGPKEVIAPCVNRTEKELKRRGLL